KSRSCDGRSIQKSKHSLQPKKRKNQFKINTLVPKISVYFMMSLNLSSVKAAKLIMQNRLFNFVSNSSHKP
ncbi:MAG: hypothetical protein OXE77_09520, partial [Flavobacteriaceae bacterium]|nr:hypothetical protein [Flavobacteriaceae bacterium]